MPHSRIVTHLSALIAVIGLLSVSTARAAAVELAVSSLDTASVMLFDPETGASTGVLHRPGIMPTGITYRGDGRLYVNDVTPGAPVTQFDLATGTPSDFTSGTQARLSIGMEFGPDGNLYRAHSDYGSPEGSQIYRYDGVTGEFLDVFATMPVNGDVYDITFGPEGNLYVAKNDCYTNEILRFYGTTGECLGTFAGAGDQYTLRGLAFGPEGDLFVAADGDHAANPTGVLRFDGSTGDLEGLFADGTGLLDLPDDLAFGPDDQLYVTGNWSDNVVRFDGTTGAFVDEFAEISGPTHLAFIPEPGTGLLLLVGLTGTLLPRIGRRRAN